MGTEVLHGPLLTLRAHPVQAHRHEVKVWETRRAPQAPGGAPFAQAPPRPHHEAPPSVPQHVPPPAEPVSTTHCSFRACERRQVKPTWVLSSNQRNPPAPAQAKLHKAPKQQKTVTGRTFTSRFRGVHQTFPTKRWEAQFRRGGKPTSLGCFDEEEEAARTYDRMMIWCHLHRELSCKHGITNYDMKEYEADYDWLMRVSQEDLIEDLRSKGRRQAATRALRSKQQGGTFGMGGAAAGAEDKQVRC